MNMKWFQYDEKTIKVNQYQLKEHTNDVIMI
jgi:hypothetical protein